MACNVALTDFEATRKSTESGHYVDLCNKCYLGIEGTFDVTERPDLKRFEECENLYILEDENDDQS